MKLGKYIMYSKFLLFGSKVLIFKWVYFGKNLYVRYKWGWVVF